MSRPKAISSKLDRAAAELIIEFVCKAYSVSKEDVLARDRHDIIAWARQVAMAITAETTTMNHAEIGRIFHRAPVTVLWAMDSVRERCETDPKTERRIDKLIEKILNETH